MTAPHPDTGTAGGFKPRRLEVDLRIVPLGFLAIILVGAVLLMLPWAHQSGRSIRWLDAFFLSTSAVCVTGLVTVNVAETFSTFGHVVLLGLIQLGGLGIFTASISLVLLSGQRLTLADEMAIRATVGQLRQVRPLDVFRYAIVFVALFELAGTAMLYHLMEPHTPELGTGRRLWDAAFHSVSAFCNAGISTYPDGMIRWRQHPAILGVIEGLVIAGSIGLMTLINLRYYAFWRRDPRRRGRLTLQTKLCLLVAMILLVGGTSMTLIFESDHTLADASGWERLSWAFFQSSMRTAGFSVVDMGTMDPPTLLGTAVLMFIGGSPGSMAGGIKTTTFALLILAAWSAVRRREDTQVFGRRVSVNLSGVAVMLGLLATIAVIAGVGLLMVTEDGQPASQTPQHWLALVFEVVSAFGTVGFSTGVTSILTSWGKFVILSLMFCGRVAPLMLSIYLARPARPRRVRYPVEELGLG